MKPNFCFLISAKWFVVFKSIGIGRLKEDEEVLHLQELCLHLPLQSLWSLSFLQDFVLQQSFFSAFVDWFFEQDFCSFFISSFVQANPIFGIRKNAKHNKMMKLICLLKVFNTAKLRYIL